MVSHAPAAGSEAPAAADAQAVAPAVAALDAWLEGMRAPHGYAGPIAHWWESNFVYTGVLYDWRYEGIIDGYRQAYLRSGHAPFLDKALRAADEVLRAQLPDGRFRNSSFQFGPIAGGTPHEAAIDAALLALAETTRNTRPERSGAYLAAARRNLEGYWEGVLWNGAGFQDQPYAPVRVANKHGTLLEAWLRLEALTGRDVDVYLRACLEAVRAAVVPAGPQAGATVHLGIGPSRLAIPIYTARAMNGVLSYALARGDESELPMLRAAARFLEGSITDEGVTWGVYGNGRPCPNPRMVAGAGDVLRFLTRMAAAGWGDTEPVTRLTATLLRQQRPSGALPTARGFGRKGLRGRPRGVELRDELPVVGWVDKAFRALTALLPPGAPLPPVAPADHAVPVRWRGREVTYRETGGRLEVSDGRGRVRYRWRKGARAPDVYAL